MKEVQLQETVLVPLFKAMSYKDVHVHQGPSEIGKDIVMWRETDVNPRVDYAVVVKADKITGKVGGNSGLSVILTQIQQCVGRNYIDHITTEPRQVRKVYVVSSKEITKDAIEHIEGALSASRLNLLVEFIDGEKLWDLIEKYLGKRTILGKLRQIQKTFDESSPHYRIVAKTTGEIGFEPKYPGADKDHPIIIPTTLTFPDTPEGNAKRDEFDKHIATGSPLFISSDYIQKLEMPDFLLPYFEDLLSGKWAIEIGSPRSTHILQIKLEMRAKNGQYASLDRIDLWPIQIGKDEITLNNEQQLMPWKITLLLNIKKTSMYFTFGVNLDDINIKLASDALHFLEAIAKGGILRIEHLADGLEMARQDIPCGMIEAPSEKRMEIVEKLLFVQNKTQVPIKYPNCSVTVEEAERLFDTVELLTTGQLPLELRPFSITLCDMTMAQRIATSDKSGAIGNFSYHDEMTMNLFGKEIPLGPVTWSWDKTFVTEDDHNSFKKELREFPEATKINIRLTPTEDCTAVATLSNWLPNTETSIPSHNYEEVQND